MELRENYCKECTAVSPEICKACNCRNVEAKKEDDEKTMLNLIPPEALEEIGKIFDKFYQRHPAVPGTGLGLSICKETVGIYKGKIEARSPGIGKGTTILVTLLGG